MRRLNIVDVALIVVLLFPIRLNAQATCITSDESPQLIRVKFDSDYRVNAYANYFFNKFGVDVFVETVLAPNCSNAYAVDSVSANYAVSLTLTQPRDEQVELTVQLDNYRAAENAEFIIPFPNANNFTIAFTPGDLIYADNISRALVGLSVYAGGDCGYAQITLRPPREEEFDHQRAYNNIASRLAFYESVCLIVTHQYTNAIELLETYMPDYVGEVAPTINLAWAYFHNEQPDQAFALLDQALQSANEGNKLLLLTKRSQLYALAFRYEEAVADMDAAIALDPDNPALYVERGQRIMLTYEWDRALADYNHALEVDPNYADAYYFRGILYASVPEGIEARRLALADFQRYLELVPNAQHATDAERYLSELQAQLDALGSP